MVAAHENAHLAQRLIAATCRKQHIGRQQLTIHADRGAPMRSKLVALLFSDLGIEASHSRPRVSNDNPFSESPIPDGQIPAGLSGPLRFHRTRARDRPRSLRVVQRRASPQWPELSHASRRPLWARGHDPRGPSPHAPRGLRRPSRALRAGAAARRNLAHGRVDQSAGESALRECPKNDDRDPGRPPAWGHEQTATASRRPGHLPDR